MSAPGQQTPGPNGPAAKRRRVEIANSTLRKPFRSPLLTRSLGTPTAASPSLIGQSPLRIKSRAGDDLGQKEDDEDGESKSRNVKVIPDSEDEEDDTVTDDSTLGQEGEGKKEGNVEIGDAGTDVQNPASPSLRGSTTRPTCQGRGRGAASISGAIQSGNGGAGIDATSLSTPAKAPLRSQMKEGGLSNRRYPSPSKSAAQAVTAATPQRRGILPPRRPGSSNFQTPAKGTQPSASSTSSSIPAGSSIRNPKTPAPTNRTNTPAVTPHIQDAMKKSQDMLTQLRAARRETQSRLAEAQKQLDLVKQAHRIQEKGSIEELIVLIEKWKGASRTAAEDLFELIRKRVDNMGGSRAWRDSRRRQQQGWGYDDELEGQKNKKKGGSTDDDYGEDGEDEQEYENDEDEEGNKDVEEEDGKEEEEDTGFTMAMMLQSLNIDPQQLGWDATEERWRG